MGILALFNYFCLPADTLREVQKFGEDSGSRLAAGKED
jgi:hypothetical protein